MFSLSSYPSLIHSLSLAGNVNTQVNTDPYYVGSPVGSGSKWLTDKLVYSRLIYFNSYRVNISTIPHCSHFDLEETVGVFTNISVLDVSIEVTVSMDSVCYYIESLHL